MLQQNRFTFSWNNKNKNLILKKNKTKQNMKPTEKGSEQYENLKHLLMSSTSSK